MEDIRAHQRIDDLEHRHQKLEIAIAENTLLTQQIADNTREMVSLFKGIKGFRTFTVWVGPLVVAIIASIAWIKGH